MTSATTGEARPRADDRAPARSLLFVPGHQGARFDKACASGADAVVLDLEDAVPPGRKDEARVQVAGWLAARAGRTGPGIVLRINGAATPWHAADVALCERHAPVLSALMLPKAEDPALLGALAARLPGVALLPLVETAAGMARVEALAAAPGVQRLVFGSIDFQAELDIDAEAGDGGSGEIELLYFRSRLVLASRAAGLPGPIDGVTTDVDDMARIEADTRRARRLGFGAKLCIHPRQVAAVNAGLTPTAAQREWALRVLAADAASGGAPVAVDGRMVDRPVVLRARALLKASER